MQVHNNTGSYTNTEYQHTHHITECLHEQEQQRQQNAAGGLKKDALFQTNVEAQSEQMDLSGIGLGETRKTSGLRKGIGFMKGVWDAMGQDNRKIPDPLITAGKEMTLEHIAATGVVQKTGLPQRMLLRVTEFRQKIKVGIYTALKRFSKEKESFTAMPDTEKRHSASEKSSKSLDKKKKEQPPGREELQLEMVQAGNSHLMDSYSKNGEYCQINDNLTYSQKQGYQDTKKATEDNEHGI